MSTMTCGECEKEIVAAFDGMAVCRPDVPLCPKCYFSLAGLVLTPIALVAIRKRDEATAEFNLTPVRTIEAEILASRLFKDDDRKWHPQRVYKIRHVGHYQTEWN